MGLIAPCRKAAMMGQEMTIKMSNKTRLFSFLIFERRLLHDLANSV
jgi:hypothetical protein